MGRRSLRTGIAIVTLSACGLAAGVLASGSGPGAVGGCLTRGGTRTGDASLLCSSAARRIGWHAAAAVGGATHGPTAPGAQLWTWSVPLPPSGRGLVSSATTYFSGATLIPIRETASIDLEHCQSMDLFIAPTPDETPESGLLAGWYGGARYTDAPPSVSGSVSGVSGRLRLAVDCYGPNLVTGAQGPTPAGMVTFTFEQVPPAGGYL